VGRKGPRHFHRIGALCRQTGERRHWRPGRILRIEARRGYGLYSDYFVVAVGDPAGYGSWIEHENLRPLSPLELLATAAE